MGEPTTDTREAPVFFEHPPTKLDLNFHLGPFPVRVHPLHWLGLALMGQMAFRIGLDVGLLWIACGFASILWHELGHAFAMRYYGSPARIQLIVFGGLAIPSYQAQSPWRRMAIAAAGPAAGFVLLAIVWGSNQLVPWAKNIPAADGPSLLDFLYFFLIRVNLFWTLLNLLPIWPLDGSRILREALALRRLRSPDYTTQQVSLGTAVALGIVGILANFGPREAVADFFAAWPWWLAWAIPGPMMTLFLFVLAYQSYEMMSRLRRPRLYVDN